MPLDKVGSLDKNDPLYEVLLRDIQPSLNLSGERDYEVFKLNASNNVYLYQETQTHAKFIGKFFYNGFGNRNSANNKMEREFANLEYMRGCGFDNWHHYIARPLGKYSHLNELLVVEYCEGESLSDVLRRSAEEGDENLLFTKLTALSFFLSCFHNYTAMYEGVNFDEVIGYAQRLADTLFLRGLTDNGTAGELYSLFECYRSLGLMWQSDKVMVHGDATPSNFLFGDDLYVITFDLERMHPSDRCFDLGRVAAELTNFFMLSSNNRHDADRFIGHFLWEYCCHLQNGRDIFNYLTARCGFYMGINLLRIARNTYFDWNHRQRLIRAGLKCLRAVPNV